MIDIHSHILAGLDDGAQDMAESIAMAEIAVSDGVRRMVATPHNAWDMGLRERVTFMVSMVRDMVRELQVALDACHVELQVVPGLEVYLIPEVLKQLDTGQAFTLDETRYLLLELPLSAYPFYTENVLFELQVKGIVPILAHPERNIVIQEDPNILYPLVERGVLIQLTATSLTGLFGSLAEKTAQRLLEHNMAHIIASDAHTLTKRSPVLSAGVEEAARMIGEQRAVAMVEDVPAAILRDEEIAIEPPRKYKPGRAWFWQR